MAKWVSLVALVVLMVLPISLLAQPGVERAGTVEKPVLPSFSVSFTGTDSQEVRNAFLELTEKNGQPVSIPDAGGKYQIRLNGRQEQKNVYGGITKYLGRNVVTTNLQNWVVWNLAAEIRRGNQLLANEAVSTEGPNVNLRATAWSQRGGAYFGTSNNWLNDNLRNRAVAEMAKTLFARLCELEGLEIANRQQPRNPETGHANPQKFRYTLVPGDSQKFNVVLDQELVEGDEIGVFRSGRQIGTIKVNWFGVTDKTLVAVSGDYRAYKKGCILKVL